jgi:hypothetical protein
MSPQDSPGFAIAKPRRLFHRSPRMTKPVCCLVLALGLAACAPKKATLVDDPSPPTGTRKPATRTSPDPSESRESPTRVVNQESGMRTPVLENRLPDKRDLTATAPGAPGGGGTIATPPTADKRGE